MVSDKGTDVTEIGEKYYHDLSEDTSRQTYSNLFNTARLAYNFRGVLQRYSARN